jgi:anti-sigma-K factor RskA
VAELAYSGQVINIVAQDFSRGVVGVATLAFFEQLIRAVKELQTTVADLQARVSALEAP